MKKLFVLVAMMSLFLATVAASQTVDLVEKDQNWNCGDKYGEAVLTPGVGNLNICISLTGLAPDSSYQLTLNGRTDVGFSGNDEIANACGAPNVGYPWVCGYWGNGEGFHNFEMSALTDSSGDFYDCYDVALPAGDYGPYVGIIVKEADSPWTPVIMDCANVEFRVPTEQEIPEFTTIGAGLVLLGAGLFAYKKRK